jgi:hypothetical protein
MKTQQASGLAISIDLRARLDAAYPSYKSFSARVRAALEEGIAQRELHHEPRKEDDHG